MKHQKTVALLGGSYYAKFLLKRHDPGDIDVWWLNMMYNAPDFEIFVPYITRWFEMHPFSRMERRRQWSHVDWLKRGHDGIPITMRHHYNLVPDSVGYPLRRVAEMGGAPLNEMFGCTHSYMMGLAILEGYERIECYGVNLMNPVETYLERPSWAFWYGFAHARGIDVDLTFSPYAMPTVLYGFKDRLEQLDKQYVPEVVVAQCVGTERYNDSQALLINEKDWQQIADSQHRRVKEEPLQVAVDKALGT